uniref:DH domain-containing protein n=1 Tax=Timema monikensis TaxID=170555 RepID=A0A7R9E8N1_9NEOP|nr:unnamed protein product [Timema monikensis]
MTSALANYVTEAGSADSGVCSPCSYISSPCPPPGRPRYCDPHLSYMDRVVMEIVETEGVYVRDLHQVIQDVARRAREEGGSDGSRKGVVSRLVVVVGVPYVGALFVDPWRHSLVGHQRLPGTFSPILVSPCFLGQSVLEPLIEPPAG